MFIPSVNVNIKVGDDVILKTDVGVTGGFFTRGHKFRVVEIYGAHGYKNEFLNIIDDEGNYVKKVSIDYVSKIIPYTEAKRIQEKINYKKEVLKNIVSDCKNKTFEIDGRDPYDGCALKKNVYLPVCQPNYSCIIYSKGSIEKYPEILRLLKIKKLKDERKD